MWPLTSLSLSLISGDSSILRPAAASEAVVVAPAGHRARRTQAQKLLAQYRPPDTVQEINREHDRLRRSLLFTSLLISKVLQPARAHILGLAAVFPDQLSFRSSIFQLCPEGSLHSLNTDRFTQGVLHVSFLLVPEFVFLFNNSFCFMFQRECTLWVVYNPDWKARRPCLISTMARSANTANVTTAAHHPTHFCFRLLNGFSTFMFTSRTGFYKVIWYCVCVWSYWCTDVKKKMITGFLFNQNGLYTNTLFQSEVSSMVSGSFT